MVVRSSLLPSCMVRGLARSSPWRGAVLALGLATSSLAPALGVLGVGAALAGCGGGAAFGDTFPDNRPADLQAVVARLDAARDAARAEARHQAIALVVRTSPQRLAATDVASGSTLWEAPVELRTVPYLAGSSVVTHEAGFVVVRDLVTGRETSRLEDHALNLVGAAGAGEDGVVVLSTGGGVGAFSRFVGLHAGRPTFARAMQQAMGAPAVAAGLAFLPWGHQNLSVVELASGLETARLRPSEGVVASALASDGGVYFGQSGVAAFGTDPSAPAFTIPVRMPGAPQLLRDAYQPPPGPNSAQSRVRLVFRPAASGTGASLEGDTAYLVFYRLVFALTPDGRSARWVAQLPRDVVGAQVIDDGVLVFDESGGVHVLATSDGRARFHGTVGGPGVVYVTSQASGLRAGAPEGEAQPLRDQLLAAAQNTDARLVPLRELAVRLLASLPEAEVTANLIAICEERTGQASVRQAACEALGERTVGAEHVVAALERHASHVRGVRPPPVGALARAAVAMGERRVVPMLVAHLRDPETEAADVAPLVRALASFGDASAIEPLADFVRLYHAESPDAGLGEGLAAALTAYRTLAGPTSRELLEEVEADALALEPIRQAARSELAALDAPATTASASDATTAPEGPDMVLTAADDPRPAELTAAHVRDALEPRRAELEQCLVTPGRVFQQARVVVVVDPSGRVLLVTTTPREVGACVEPIVRAASYPATQARSRQQLTYEIRR